MASALKDVFGQALMDYHFGRPWEDLQTWTSLAGEDVLPLEHLFRSFEQMPKLEQKALKMAKGKVLDVGCGSGTHAEWLQKEGFEVTGIDHSPGAVRVCKDRGIRTVIQGDIFEHEKESYDTIYLLMNGIGMCGSMAQLPRFLEKLKSLLSNDGQILTDSSNLIYMFEDGQMELPQDHYYGELRFDTFYKGERSGEFPWLYVDFENLKWQCSTLGLKCEKLEEGSNHDYLARITIA